VLLFSALGWTFPLRVGNFLWISAGTFSWVKVAAVPCLCADPLTALESVKGLTVLLTTTGLVATTTGC